MTLKELKAVLPPVALWMAYAAVMQGVRTHHKVQELSAIESKKREAGELYNFALAQAHVSGVNVAAEVLYKLFASCSAECHQAIAAVAQHKDGYHGDPMMYFDDFVTALEKVQRRPVRLRSSE